MWDLSKGQRNEASSLTCHQQNDNWLEQLESLVLLDLVILVTLDQIHIYFQILVILVFYPRSSYFYN